MTLKAFKYRIKPNKEQRIIIEQSFGNNRFVWNYCLNLNNRYYAMFGKMLNKNRMINHLVKMKSRFDWLKDCNAQSLQQTVINLYKAFDMFFKKIHQRPKFKSKKNPNKSFSNPQRCEVKFELGCIKMPNLGLVKAKLHRHFEGEVKTCTLSQTPTGKYYVSVLVDDGLDLPSTAPVDEAYTLGIDVGIKDFVVTSNNDVFPNIRPFQKAQDALAKEQRILSRKKKGSKTREKQRVKVATLHERVANVRNNYHHIVSSKLVGDSQVTSICVEDLNVKGMIRNKKLSKHISDVAWSAFLTKLQYKLEWQGKNLITIDRFAPSSKTCSNCSSVKTELKLSDRTYVCGDCNTVIDRDYNAALNIKSFGLSQLAERDGMSRAVKCSHKARTVSAVALPKGIVSQYESAEAPSRTVFAV